jgi:hypothetical protein
MTKEAFEAYLVAHPDQKAALTDGYTVVRARATSWSRFPIR